MNNFRKYLLRNERKVLRLLEILPGFVSWNLILLPWWGILVFPTFIALFILVYNVYWFYQSFQITVAAIVSHMRIQAAMKYDWVADVREFPDWKKVRHLIIIPTYKEPLYILEKTFSTIKEQTLPLKQIHIILAMEKKEDKKDREKKVKALKEKFGKSFGGFYTTSHNLVIGETVGKHSNELFAAKWAKKRLVDKGVLSMDYTIVTSCDADHKYHPNHFAYLAYKFLDEPDRYKRFWQPAIMFSSNVWELPSVTRITNVFGTIWNMSTLARKDKLINQQNYSLSFRMLHRAGYWHPDRIPEDWGIFFKSYFEHKGGIEVEPLYLPLYADAPKSKTTFKTIKNQYSQYMRWAWGVSDTPWIIFKLLTVKGIPRVEKFVRVFSAVWGHFTWPVNWFVITIGLTLPSLLNPTFARTSLGYTVPRLSSAVLTYALVFLIFMFAIDYAYRPPRPKSISKLKAILMPLEFIMMPVVGFFLNALPGLDAHTRLMLGKYIEYKVTEKV